MGIDLSDKSIEQTGYNPKESEDALEKRYKAMFDMYVDFIRKGITVESYYEDAKNLAQKYGFSTEDLENSLSDCLKKQFSKHLELIESGRLDCVKTARDEAKKYGYSEQAVINAEAVGKRVHEEITQSAQITQKPNDALGMKIKLRK